MENCRIRSKHSNKHPCGPLKKLEEAGIIAKSAYQQRQCATRMN